MHWIDIAIFVVYMIVMLGIGFFFLKSNSSKEDYYLAGRNMGPWHIGFSVVATDVGGGFSIGLGGLGFTMGLSGSWMLFTGLVGAWLAAVFLIPRVFELGKKVDLFTFPQIFGQIFNGKVALIAAAISAIGYLGFTASQMLAGAKLAHATFPVVSLNYALVIMGVVAVIYTVMGGLKAVIYTDTVQWIILLSGLIFIGLPMGYFAVGGWEGISASVPPEMLTLNNLTWQNMVNWCVTIIPIWFIGMTLYQRIYASRNEKQARKAWYIAGVFEWPIMAFMGVVLGLFARVAADQGMFAEVGYASAMGMDPEIGLPLLLRTILPVGLMGLMMSAYFSAILSTADSCLMACSGNVVTDLLYTSKYFRKKNEMRLSQLATLAIGGAAILIALFMENVLELMLHSYAFMVSGLFLPVLYGLYSKRPSATAAMASMFAGGGVTLTLTILSVKLPFGLDPIIFGLAAALIVLIVVAKSKDVIASIN
ncbi:sodium:solute symporter family protein [Cryomorpha ignava]|uniref:Sodium:solute symporter family protein n=1 Tax=Cryomorpha ignava TaxID=101383 RepID=A0A7K3WRY8_9FLAO|nr:sodium:solute symporter family protein [Cryomorpha ignava]NEN24437.1 sodium:solute symporter family protein [Cryomorpha ignava]